MPKQEKVSRELVKNDPDFIKNYGHKLVIVFDSTTKTYYKKYGQGVTSDKYEAGLFYLKDAFENTLDTTLNTFEFTFIEPEDMLIADLSKFGKVEKCEQAGTLFEIKITTGFDNNAHNTLNLMQIIMRHLPAYPKLGKHTVKKDLYHIILKPE